MSAEEGMRGELTVEEPTKTAGNLAFYASSVSTSAATFPRGEGLDRLISNGSMIAAAVGGADCHTSDVGHWFAMTVENPTFRNDPNAVTIVKPFK